MCIALLTMYVSFVFVLLDLPAIGFRCRDILKLIISHMILFWDRTSPFYAVKLFLGMAMMTKISKV